MKIPEAGNQIAATAINHLTGIVRGGCRLNRNDLVTGENDSLVFP